MLLVFVNYVPIILKCTFVNILILVWNYIILLLFIYFLFILTLFYQCVYDNNIITVPNVLSRIMTHYR